MSNLKRLQERLVTEDLDGLLLFDENNIRWLGGFHISDGAALVTHESCFLFTDSRYIEAAEAALPKEITPLLCSGQSPVMKQISDRVAEKDIGRLGIEDDKINLRLYLSLKEKLDAELLEKGALMSSLRSIKSEDELRSLEAAQDISELAFFEIIKRIKPGVSEFDIAAELSYQMLKFGAEGNSFPPICLVGKRCSLPHGVPSEAKAESGQFILMDFGCVKNGYCSDMTRTIALGGVSEEMELIYNTVLRAQNAGLEKIRAGVSGAEVHDTAADVIEKAGFGQYFGHGFGHGVGLDVHEDPRVSPANKDPLPAGAVVSAEPGIYIPDKIGVRIENVVYITEDGYKPITKLGTELMII